MFGQVKSRAMPLPLGWATCSQRVCLANYSSLSLCGSTWTAVAVLTLSLRTRSGRDRRYRKYTRFLDILPSSPVMLVPVPPPTPRFAPSVLQDAKSGPGPRPNFQLTQFPQPRSEFCIQTAGSIWKATLVATEYNIWCIITQRGDDLRVSHRDWMNSHSRWWGSPQHWFR